MGKDIVDLSADDDIVEQSQSGEHADNESSATEVDVEATIVVDYQEKQNVEESTLTLGGKATSIVVAAETSPKNTPTEEPVNEDQVIEEDH